MIRIIINILILIPLVNLAQENNKSNLFGFATSNTFTYCNISDTNFLNKVIALNPKVLRFPGGAVGNFYHFGSNGYGFDFKEIDKYDAGRFSKRSRGLVRSSNKKGHYYDYIDDFIKLARKTNSKVVLVANMFVDNNDIIKMIEKIQLNNIEIIGVELGSELSNRTFYEKGYTINEYKDAAKRCSEKIKQKFPEIKTAIVAAPLVNKKSHRHSVWNEKLAKMNFYDAIIIHSYARVVKGRKEFGQMLTEIPEGDSKEEAFKIYKERIFKYFNSDYPKEVIAYKELFNKPIWVTEWNLQIAWTTGNTMLQSLYVANYFLELLSNKELENIELTTFHNLGGRDYSGSIFMENKDILEIHSTYFSLKFIGQIFNVKDLNIKKEIISEDVFKYLIFSGDNLIYWCIINWSSEQVITNLEMIKLVDISTFFSEKLFDKANIEGKFFSSKETNKSVDLITFEPYSISLITFLDE